MTTTFDLTAPKVKVRGRGRPRSTKPLDKAGLGSFLSARISTEVREALEAEADRTGRSISQIAERWIEKGRLWEALERKLLDERSRLSDLRDAAASQIVRARDSESLTDIMAKNGCLDQGSHPCSSDAGCACYAELQTPKTPADPFGPSGG